MQLPIVVVVIAVVVVVVVGGGGGGGVDLIMSEVMSFGVGCCYAVTPQ